MKKIKKRYIILCLTIILLGLVAILLIFIPRKKAIPKPVDVFGAPRVKTSQNFPVENHEFTADIGKIKPDSVDQQSITVYQIGDPQKTIVFQRPFYADDFRGNDLTYTFSSGSAEIIQTGSLGSLGCKSDDCTLPWSNYYIWDANQRTFVLNNGTHKDMFEQLFTKYQAIDKNGCNMVGTNLVTAQEGLSFTEIYKKYPTDKYYCSKTQGILPSNLKFFLQAEKTLSAITNGEDLGSADIRNIPY